jgi:methionine synthase / methylenetetrahydrofolate reductase(NADPH)
MAALDDKAARVCGMRVAEEIIGAALQHFPGVYLITPFLHYEIMTELATFARSR